MRRREPASLVAGVDQDCGPRFGTPPRGGRQKVAERWISKTAARLIEAGRLRLATFFRSILPPPDHRRYRSGSHATTSTRGLAPGSRGRQSQPETGPGLLTVGLGTVPRTWSSCPSRHAIPTPRPGNASPPSNGREAGAEDQVLELSPRRAGLLTSRRAV